MASLTGLAKHDAYKDSGSNWLGEIPRDWVVTKFKYLARVRKGKIPKRIVSENNSNLPAYLSMEYLRGSEANQFVEDKNPVLVEDGSILLLWDGSNAGEFILGKRGVVSSTLASIDFSSVTKKFAWYACQVTEMQLRSATVGMGIPHVDGNQLKNSLLAIPSIVDQKLIANFLDKKTTQIDEAIAIKEKQIALLKERKQIIIQKAVTQGLNPDVPMKDSGVDWIGKIPEHWAIYANRALFEERVEAGKDGLPLLSVSIHSGVSNEEMSEDENVRGRVKIEDKSKYILIKKGDVAFNMMRAWQGGIGSSSVDGMVSPAYIVAKPKSLINSDFFEFQYRCPEFIQQMDRYSKGITDFRKRLYWDSFKQLSTVVPPKDEQLDIVEYIKVQSSKVESGVSLLSDQIEKLKEYKATLINSAVTGKIKVV